MKTLLRIKSEFNPYMGAEEPMVLICTDRGHLDKNGNLLLFLYDSHKKNFVVYQMDSCIAPGFSLLAFKKMPVT
jgi:hypothetical protein